MIYQQDRFSYPTMMTTTVVEKEDVGMSEREPRFVNEYPDNLLRVAKQEDQSIASLLVYFASGYGLRNKT